MNIDTENKSNILQIQVYDSFTIDFNKYPRKNTPKYETDVVMIHFLMHQDYLEKVAKSYTTAIQFYNECKEYYFMLKSLDGKNSKRYSAQELMFIINQIKIFSSKNPDIYSIQKYIRNFHPLDQLYYILIKNKEFYLELFRNMTDAKFAFFERREINYKFFIPFDFYGDIKSMNSNKGQVYTALELLEINAYVQFLVKKKIIKNLPEPLLVRNYFDIDKHIKPKDIKPNKNLKNEIKNKNKTIIQENNKQNLNNSFPTSLNQNILQIKQPFESKKQTNYIDQEYLDDLQRIINESEKEIENNDNDDYNDDYNDNLNEIYEKNNDYNNENKMNYSDTNLNNQHQINIENILENQINGNEQYIQDNYYDNNYEDNMIREKEDKTRRMENRKEKNKNKGEKKYKKDLNSTKNEENFNELTENNNFSFKEKHISLNSNNDIKTIYFS